ncbi:MAG TPA: VWA domain-containing protein [Thermoanaerobaculia bacterium]|nr:VWA domain-containing protein [Thermoanaerobaculia bacterium]
MVRQVRAVALIALFASTLAAQSLREVTTVEVVEVPVYVTASGDPLTGLTRDQFRLFVNGKPQSIDYFDVVDFAGLSPEEAQNPRQRRLYFLLFDLSSDIFALGRARKAVDAFVQQAAATDRFAVATLGQQGLNILMPFTQDRGAIRHAVRSLRADTQDPLRIASGSLAQEILESQRTKFDEGSEQPEAGTNELAEMMQELEAEPLIRTLEDTLKLIDGIARQLAPLEGHKHVVLFSTGFDPTLATGGRSDTRISNLQQGVMADLAAPIVQKMVTPPAGAPKSSSTLLKALDALNARYASAAVFLDAIDIAGVRSMMFGDGNRGGLYMLARTGQVIANRNDIGAAIRDLTDMQRVVYVLGFHPRNTRKQNSIRVELENVPGHPRVTHRRSFSTTPEPSSSSDLLLADIVSNDIPQNGLSVTVDVDTSKLGIATVSATIPGRELLALGNHHVSAKALIYVFAGSRAIAFQGKEIEIDPRRARALEDLDLRLSHSFDLPPGQFTAKVLLRVDGVDARGFGRVGFEMK